MRLLSSAEAPEVEGAIWIKSLINHQPTENIISMGRGALNSLLKRDRLSLSTREMQCYGAVCLRRYCSKFKINHGYIDDVIKHQMPVIATTDLASWEKAGCQLELSGRGDPIPPSVLERVPLANRFDFEALLIDTTEIGLINMYSADTDEPLKIFKSVKARMVQNDVPLPEEHNFQVQSRRLRGAWGDPLNEEMYNAFLHLLTAQENRRDGDNPCSI